jgi:hypothetical protein
VPSKLDNIFDSMMQLLQDSNEHKDVLSFYLQYNTLWNDEIKTVTENRINTDIPLLANVWYSAFVQAGLAISAPAPTPAKNYTPYLVGGVLALALIGVVITLYIKRR